MYRCNANYTRTWCIPCSATSVMSKVFHNISEVRLSEVHLSKVHHRLCGIIPFHRFTKNFLPRSTLARGNHKGISKVHPGPPPSLWNTTISQAHQEFPSYPRFTLAQGNHKGVSKVHHHLCGIQTFRRLTKNFLPIQYPPWPKETIKMYSKVHQGPPQSLEYNHFTGSPRNSFLSKIHPGPRKP